ncbi:hypothetical protein [Planctomicrobium sp. SH527]|uniref:hypothetical protein n=1 Tax=Planctomicrobium sp. SH527 TaxID=3448123 RepID=UPI003F5BA38B
MSYLLTVTDPAVNIMGLHSYYSRLQLNQHLSGSPYGSIYWKGMLLGLLLAGVWTFVSTPTRQITAGVPDSSTGQRTIGSDQVEVRGQSGVEGVKEVPDSAGKVTVNSAEVVVSDDNLVGRWLLDQSIRREIDIRPDGTASMKVTLDFLTSLIYGKELTLNLNWTLKGNLLTHTVVSGVPQANVDRLVSQYGASMTYRVVESSPDGMILEGPLNSSSREDWKPIR